MAPALQLQEQKDASSRVRKPTTKEKDMETENQAIETCNEEPRILEEIRVEELAIDGICGVY